MTVTKLWLCINISNKTSPSDYAHIVESKTCYMLIFVLAWWGHKGMQLFVCNTEFINWFRYLGFLAEKANHTPKSQYL